MKKRYNIEQKRSVRRVVRQWFSSLVKRQDADYLEKIFDKLQDIEDSIDIITREIARQIKSGE